LARPNGRRAEESAENVGSLLAVLFAVRAACVLTMLSRVGGMAMSGMGMMRGLFVIAGFMMLRGLSMMARGMREVFRSFAVVIGSFLGHGPSFPAC
jgi:hypothetical protein